MKNEAIFRMNFDCGRNGSLRGIFVAEKEKVAELVRSKKEIYFGEVLGKHSEICGPVEEGEIEMITDDDEAVGIFNKFDLATGFNPFDYEEDEEDAE